MLRVIRYFARHAGSWVPGLAGAVYAVGAAIFGRIRFAYEVDPDEGFNLMKMMLVERGHTLYREIWSDQPPGFTYLGVLFIRLFGESVENVRLVTTLLAGALMFALADLLRRAQPGVGGLVAGVAAAVALPVTANFSRYSMAAMIGLPALAFSVLSLWALVVSESRRPAWLIVSGLLFAASLITKLFTLFLVPVFGALLIWQVLSAAQPRRARVALRALATWALTLAIALGVGLGPALLDGGWAQLYSTHVSEQVKRAPELGRLLRYLLADAGLYALAAAALVLSILRRNPIGLALSSWYVLALGVVAVHTPLWHHHLLLVSIPASGLTGLLTGWVAEFLNARRGWPRLVGACAIVAALIASLVPLTRARTTASERAAKRERQLAVDAAIRRHAPHARLMVTARQIRAFRLGLPVPPELAVTSSKRFKSGQLSAERIRSIVLQQRPDVVVIDRRWPESVREMLKRTVKSRYHLVYSDPRSDDAAVYVLGRAP